MCFVLLYMFDPGRSRDNNEKKEHYNIEGEA